MLGRGHSGHSSPCLPTADQGDARYGHRVGWGDTPSCLVATHHTPHLWRSHWLTKLGHVALRHLAGSSALIDLEDPATATGPDVDEEAADAFALATLTGSETPEIRMNTADFGAQQLAQVVLEVGPQRAIDPGTLALCVGFLFGRWPAAMSSLRHIYRSAKPVWSEVNRVAETSLDWGALTEDEEDYLRAVMGLGRA